MASSTKGSVHPNNIKLATTADTTLLDRLDFFFGDPKRSEAIGNFLSREAPAFQGFDDTNSPAGLAGYALFKQYSTLIDTHLTAFCEEEGLPLHDVASACVAEMSRLEGAPSSYVCLSYVCAALDMDSFVDLIYEMKDMQAYGLEEEDGEGEAEEGTEAVSAAGEASS